MCCLVQAVEGVPLHRLLQPRQAAEEGVEPVQLSGDDEAWGGGPGTGSRWGARQVSHGCGAYNTLTWVLTRA